HDVGVRGTHGAVVGVGGIRAAVGQANVIQYGFELVRRNSFADRIFDQVAKLGRVFDASAGARADMQPHLSTIDVREKILAQPGEQRKRSYTSQEKANRKRHPMAYAPYQKLPVAVAHPLKIALEELLQPHKRIAEIGMRHRLMV